MAATISQPVVVITGASSGIGRATALAFARTGASVVVAARREDLLDEVARECIAEGGKALPVTTDVTDEAAVESLAVQAEQAFGPIDVWVNNAGVLAYGPFDDTPLEVFARVIETNLYGCTYGARAALLRFRERQRGVLINVGSIASKMSEPFASAYVASKHAIRGLGIALRQELLDQPDIHVCTVMPATVDTPLFQHAANFTGHAIKAAPPIYAADRVADVIVRLSRRPRREVFVGGSAWRMNLLFTIAQKWGERALARLGESRKFNLELPSPSTEGNLFAPLRAGRSVSGGRRIRKNQLLRAASVLGALAIIPLAVAITAVRYRPARFA
jgi:NAD(P)-dependent dehydrogenase (short-subunit alcohol dehydrogenase family)